MQSLLTAKRLNKPRLEVDQLHALRMNEMLVARLEQRRMLEKLNRINDIVEKITEGSFGINIESTKDVDYWAHSARQTW